VRHRVFAAGRFGRVSGGGLDHVAGAGVVGNRSHHGCGRDEARLEEVLDGIAAAERGRDATNPATTAPTARIMSGTVMTRGASCGRAGSVPSVAVVGRARVASSVGAVAVGRNDERGEPVVPASGA